MKRVTGIGGIFFKANDPAKLKEWYKKHLGIDSDKYGAVFEWGKHTEQDKPGYTVWSPMSDNTTYYEPSRKDLMINYRVHDLEALLAVLADEGVQIVGKMETYSYGKFGWVMDPEGNKIELWEPFDDKFPPETGD